MCEINISRTKLAENLVAGVQYLSRRDVLSDISSSSSMMSLTCEMPKYDNNVIEWTKIEQVGITSDYSVHKSYAAIQKALLSCHQSNQKQVIFLIHGDGEKINLYIGIKKINEEDNTFNNNSFTESFATNLNGLLPGSKISYLDQIDDIGKQLQEDIKEKKYRHLYALTGIPSIISNNGEESFSSIDKLIGPLSRKRFVYYVVADPITESTVSNIMTQYLEMSGKIESIKSLNISEATNTAVTIGKTESIFNTLTENTSISVNRKGKKYHFWCKCMSTMGLEEFIDQSTNTITRGMAHGQAQGQQLNMSTGFTATKSMTLINKCAEFAANQLNQHAERYKMGLGLGMWETGVYLLTEDAYTGQSASMLLRSIASGHKSYLEPIRIHDLSKLINMKNKSTNIIDALRTFCVPNITIEINENNVVKSNNGFGNEGLTTILTTEEVSSYINLPQKAIPGISLIEYSDNFGLTPQRIPQDQACIHLGKLVYSGSLSSIPIDLPIDTLSKHTLVCGVNGSGKTNTVLNVLKGLIECNRSFLVIEPAKTEYVDWAIDYNKSVSDPSEKIKIFIPGCDFYVKKNEKPSILKINPFEVINIDENKTRVLSHIDRLKTIFAAAFPMEDILPVVLEHLLYKLYTDVCPIIMNYMKKGFPMLSDINKGLIKDLMNELGYATENTQNISAALRTRFNSLKYGWKKEMLNNQQITDMTWGDFFNSRCVINLSYVGDDQDKAFIMSLILQFLYEYRIAETEIKEYSFNENKCRHLVVVEEAHRIMGECLDPQLPQYRSSKMFSSFLSEIRAYGQGMMIVDQIPSRLIEDAIKNTNIKIIHKLVASDDAKILGESIGLTLDQERIIPRLSVGKAILAGLNSNNVENISSEDIFLSQINKMK